MLKKSPEIAVTPGIEVIRTEVPSAKLIESPTEKLCLTASQVEAVRPRVVPPCEAAALRLIPV